MTSYIHTYKHRYIHTYMHTFIHTYIHTSIRIHTYIPTYIHTYIQTYIHTNIHTYIHTYMHTYKFIDTDICTYVRTCMHTYKQFCVVYFNSSCGPFRHGGGDQISIPPKKVTCYNLQCGKSFYLSEKEIWLVITGPTAPIFSHMTLKTWKTEAFSIPACEQQIIASWFCQQFAHVCFCQVKADRDEPEPRWFLRCVFELKTTDLLCPCSTCNFCAVTQTVLP